MEENIGNYHVVNVINFPLGDDILPSIPEEQERRPVRKWFQISRFPRAYIGNGTRRYTFIPFSLLLITSIILGLWNLYLLFRHHVVISDVNLKLGVFLSFLLCFLDISASIIGLNILNNSIVAPGKLLLLHATMFFAILIHIFVPVYEFMPDKSVDNKDVQNKFPDEYWACRETNDIAAYERKRAYHGFCNEVIKLGNYFWSTLVQFGFLLIAWRMTLCRRPVPIHPDIHNSDELRNVRKSLRKRNLSKIYKKWEGAGKLQEKLYYAHYPRISEDENANNDMNLNPLVFTEITPGPPKEIDIA